MTVAEFLSEWLDMVVRPTMRYNTHRSYECAVRVHIVPAIGALSLADLTVLEVQRFIAALASDSRLSSGTVRLIVSVLTLGLTWAVRRGLIQRNPAEGAAIPAVEHAPSRPLDRTEAAAFIAACSSERLGGMFVLAIQTGMRRGELLGLGWQHVDLAARTLTVERQWLANAVPPRFGPPKTKAGKRPIPLPSLSVAALTDRRERQATELLRADPRARAETDLVFTRETGHPVTYENWDTTLRRIFRRAGLAYRGGHQLRHTAASLWAAEGIHPSVVMAIMGHSSIAPTLSIYTHTSAETLADAGKVMDRLAEGDG